MNSICRTIHKNSAKNKPVILYHLAFSQRYKEARYQDPKTSRWLSTDPALGEYIPGAPVNDEVKKANGNLPGMGGVFNTVNLHLYHYAGNNPVKYLDPTGMAILATRNVVNMFYNSTMKHITSIYGRGQRGSFTFYDQNGNKSLLFDYGNNSNSMEQLNHELLRDPAFSFFASIADEFKTTVENDGDVSFSSKRMDGKLDNDGNQYYELSVNIGEEKSLLMYYTEVDADTKDELLNDVGDLFSRVKGGEIEDWKPSADTEIKGETPFN
jgi:hypothetical protein